MVTDGCKWNEPERTLTKQSWKKRRSVPGAALKVSCSFWVTAPRTSVSTLGHVDA
jgi:hypothetical protein